MKKINQANRGKNFELFINQWLEAINKNTDCLGIRIEVKTVLRGGRQVRVKKQPFDYVLLCPCPGQDFAFDAKTCKDKKLYFSHVPAHQKENLAKCQRQGKKAGFLIWFSWQDPLKQNLRFVEDWSKPASIESGERFCFQKFIGETPLFR